MTRPLKLALLGCGSVGSQVVRLLREQADDLTARVGAPIELVGVAVRRPELQRDAEVPQELLTTDAVGLVSRGDIVVMDEFLPADVAPGDLLAVPGTGAYCRSLSSQYNHTPRPPVVAVRDGQARVLVRRETVDDLLALDVG